MDEYADIAGGEMLEDSNLLQDLAGNAFNVQTCVFATVVLCTTLAFLHQEREKARQMRRHQTGGEEQRCNLVRSWMRDTVQVLLFSIGGYRNK